MLELVMGASHPDQKPPIRFQLLDDLLAVHGGYYNHPNGCGNALFLASCMRPFSRVDTKRCADFGATLNNHEKPWSVPNGTYLWAITVNGNWRLIFRFDGEDAELIDYLDYH